LPENYLCQGNLEMSYSEQFRNVIPNEINLVIFQLKLADYF